MKRYQSHYQRHFLERCPWRFRTGSNLNWCVFILVIGLFGCGKKSYQSKSTEQLEKLVSSNNPNEQTGAIFAIGQRGQSARQTIPSLCQSLQSPEPIVRQSSARALGKMGAEAKEAIPELIHLVTSDSLWFVRRQAVIALREIAPDEKQVKETIQKATKDENSLVRQAAQDSLSPPK